MRGSTEGQVDQDAIAGISARLVKGPACERGLQKIVAQRRALCFGQQLAPRRQVASIAELVHAHHQPMNNGICRFILIGEPQPGAFKDQQQLQQGFFLCLGFVVFASLFRPFVRVFGSTGRLQKIQKASSYSILKMSMPAS